MSTMPLQRIAAIGCVCLALASGMGCQQSASRHTIAVIPRDTAEEVWSSEHGGAAAAAQRHGLSVYWNGPNREDDAEQQIALAERAVHARDYGILLSPNHPFELTTIVQRALDRSIPLVLLGSRLSIKRFAAPELCAERRQERRCSGGSAHQYNAAWERRGRGHRRRSHVTRFRGSGQRL